ncbi:NAD-glutamate dehydrogenase, partial [Streptomyces albidoflavus]|uniref:NAD-glutamate dehydrogenase n=1 Tax=Streptomyces albidoflavus TaxID=1886 RepID=UPI001C539733
VGTMVLRNNYAQNTALANSTAQRHLALLAQQRFMRRLTREDGGGCEARSYRASPTGSWALRSCARYGSCS